MFNILVIIAILVAFQERVLATDVSRQTPSKQAPISLKPPVQKNIGQPVKSQPAIGMQKPNPRPLPILPILGSNVCSVPCQDKLKMSPVVILSIDGASVRGIAQFKLLQAIEKQVIETLQKALLVKNKNINPAAPKTISDIFDFFAGTSAGSVNVGSILIPENAAQSNLPGQTTKPKFTLAELRNQLPETLAAAFSGTAFRKVRTLGGLAGSKYTAKELQKKLEDVSGETRMSDLVKPAIITSYDIRHRQTMNFSTYDACSLNNKDESPFMMPDQNGNMIKDINVYLWQAVRASSAAPVFYKPLELKIGGKDRALIDAGLFVMSPTLLSWIEVQKLYPCRRILVVSIASGVLVDNVRKIKSKGATAGSIPNVLEATIETALEGQQLLTDEMMQNLPNITYHRITFDVENKEFDDFSEKNVKTLEEAAQRTIEGVKFKDAVKAIVDARLERLNDSQPTVFTCAAKEAGLKKEHIAKQYFGTKP